MKFLHLSDLHLGKRLNEFSMLADQAYILRQILAIVDEQKPDGVLIAGDIYDKTVPPAEAVTLFDDFLVELVRRRTAVFAISGNHDSPERIAFAARLVKGSGVYLSPVYDGTVERVTLEDPWGPVDVFLLPFLKPIHVRRCFPDEMVESYTDAVGLAIAHMDIEPSHRSVLVTHQFVTGAERCESEEISVGGSDSVDASVFEPFDYVALGHLHGPQNVGCETVRYCGTPLKYSFSETRQEKSVTVVELGEKGKCHVSTIPLKPRRDMVELRGSYDRLAAADFYRGLDREAYYHLILTDEEDVPEAVGKLRVIYPNLMKLSYDNSRTRRADGGAVYEREERALSPMELFADFFRKQNGHDLSEEQRDYLAETVEQVWEEKA